MAKVERKLQKRILSKCLNAGNKQNLSIHNSDVFLMIRMLKVNKDKELVILLRETQKGRQL